MTFFSFTLRALVSGIVERPHQLQDLGLLLGPPAGGKNYILKVNRPLFPPEAWYEGTGRGAPRAQWSPATAGRTRPLRISQSSCAAAYGTLLSMEQENCVGIGFVSSLLV